MAKTFTMIFLKNLRLDFTIVKYNFRCPKKNGELGFIFKNTLQFVL